MAEKSDSYNERSDSHHVKVIISNLRLVCSLWRTSSSFSLTGDGPVSPLMYDDGDWSIDEEEQTKKRTSESQE